jgi:site-specific recombinase XerD
MTIYCASGRSSLRATTGKGRRERALPLWKTTAAALRAWLAVRGRVATPEVFVNARGEPLSRWGFAYLLKQHAATAARAHPGLGKKRISPHVLRHYLPCRTMSSSRMMPHDAKGLWDNM